MQRINTAIKRRTVRKMYVCELVVVKRRDEDGSADGAAAGPASGEEGRVLFLYSVHEHGMNQLTHA